MEQKNILILVGLVFLILAGYMVVNSLMDKANQEKLNISTQTFDPSLVSGKTGIEISLNYTGDWTGCITRNEANKISSQTLSGTGPKTFPLNGTTYAVGFDFQKMDNTNNTLTASLIENGKVVNSTNTSDKYGIVGFWGSLANYN
jgi:hypothetical protein